MDLEPSSKKQLLNDLIKKYQCLNCKNSILGDIITCVNDHQICMNCSKKTNICLVCKSHILNVNKTMENMVSTVFSDTPLFKCYYKECDKMMIKSEFKQHLCECSNKEWQSPFNNLIRHKYVTTHLEYLKNYNLIMKNNIYEKHIINMEQIPNNSIYKTSLYYHLSDMIIYINIQKYGTDTSYNIIWQSKTKTDWSLSVSTKIFNNINIYENDCKYLSSASYYHILPNLSNYIGDVDQLKHPDYYFPILPKNNSISKFKNHNIKLEFTFGFQP
jgi:hypothetical protein